MKYLVFLAFIICSTASSADLDCKQLSKIADENGTMFGTKYFLHCKIKKASEVISTMRLQANVKTVNYF